jgi:gas vesicle protein
LITRKDFFMRSGKYESSENGGSVGTAVTFLLIGLGAGALVGLLLAPKSGKQLRRELRGRYDDAREAVEDFADEAKDRVEEVLDRGSEIAEKVRDKVAPLTKGIRRG